MLFVLHLKNILFWFQFFFCYCLISFSLLIAKPLKKFFFSLNIKSSKKIFFFFSISFPLFSLEAAPLQLFLSRSLMTSMPVVSSHSSSYITHQQHGTHCDIVLKVAPRTQVLLLRIVAGFSIWLWSLALNWPLALLKLKGLMEEEPRIEMRRLESEGHQWENYPVGQREENFKEMA